MLATLAAHWRLLLFRGVVTVLFGIVVVAWPVWTAAGLAGLFGAYAFVDGFLALILAFIARGLPGFVSSLIEGLVGVGIGIATVLYPDMTADVLIDFIALWALLTGIASIAAAITLRRELSGEWPLPVAGGLSVILGTLLLVSPRAGMLGMVWMIGLFAILEGIALAALAIRLRQLAHEIARA